MSRSYLALARQDIFSAINRLIDFYGKVGGRLQLLGIAGIITCESLDTACINVYFWLKAHLGFWHVLIVQSLDASACVGILETHNIHKGRLIAILRTYVILTPIGVLGPFAVGGCSGKRIEAESSACSEKPNPGG